jgi:hypothetical protein
VTEGEKKYSINIPANMDCDFILTNTRDLSVFLNRNKIEKGIGNLSLEPGLNTIIIKSGI